MAQRSPNGCWDEVGCFVYKVIDLCDVRHKPSVSDEARIRDRRLFEEDEMVSIDLIRHSRCKNSVNGPFLRLSDGSGWMFERKNNVIMMERVDVEVGLWTFFADNYPNGIGLRLHPVDVPELRDKQITFACMQKVFCDRKVRDDSKNVTFYRVQGTVGWVFDFRKPESTMMLNENMVEKGLFAYKALSAISIRNGTNIGEECKTLRCVKKDDIIAVDCIRQSPFKAGDGPFLRLSDGSGWLFQYKYHDKMMEATPVEEGFWRLRVSNSVGISVRSQPIDDGPFRTSKILSHGSVVDCDRRIPISFQKNFYRVKGMNNGWVFDNREDYAMMELISSSHTSNVHSVDGSGGRNNDSQAWSIEYLRGIADAIGGLEEIIMQNNECPVIYFQNKVEGYRINIYYTTRTVGTCLGHPRQGKTQLFRRNCSKSELSEIMRNPRIHTGKGYQTKKKARISSFQQHQDEEDVVVVDAEVEIRNSILECDEEMARLNRRKIELLKSALWRDHNRRHEIVKFEILRKGKEEEHETMVQKGAQLQAEAVMQRRRAKEREAQIIQAVTAEIAEMQRKQEVTCPECHQEFINRHAFNQHYDAVHQQQYYDCDHCGKSFTSSKSLYQHIDATGHY